MIFIKLLITDLSGLAVLIVTKNIIAMVRERAISVKGSVINIIDYQDSDYISLTDMAVNFGDDTLIYSWMRNRNTLEFIGIREELNNPDFKGNEFVTFKMQAGDQPILTQKEMSVTMPLWSNWLCYQTLRVLMQL